MKSVKNVSHEKKKKSPTLRLLALTWMGTCEGRKVEKVHNLERPLYLQNGDSVNITWHIDVKEEK